MNFAIEMDNVTYARDGVRILDGVTLRIPTGSVSAIIGPNGAGKTTLLRILAGLIDAEGKIVFHRAGAARPGSRPRVGYVPQSLDFDRGVPIRVLDFLVMGRQRWPIWFGILPSYRRRAENCLQRVEAKHLLLRPLGKLSGGELQRVLLALALQDEPEVLLLDEPVSGVDIVGERLFCDILEQVQRDAKFTMVMVSHDFSVVSRHATHVICLNRKVQCEGPPPTVMTATNLASAFGPHVGLFDHQCSSTHVHDHAPVVHSIEESR